MVPGGVKPNGVDLISRVRSVCPYEPGHPRGQGGGQWRHFSSQWAQADFAFVGVVFEVMNWRSD